MTVVVVDVVDDLRVTRVVEYDSREYVMEEIRSVVRTPMTGIKSSFSMLGLP